MGMIIGPGIGMSENRFRAAAGGGGPVEGVGFNLSADGVLYQESGKITLISHDGLDTEPVGAWVDGSGEGNDLEQQVTADKLEHHESLWGAKGGLQPTAGVELLEFVNGPAVLGNWLTTGFTLSFVFRTTGTTRRYILGMQREPYFNNTSFGVSILTTGDAVRFTLHGYDTVLAGGFTGGNAIDGRISGIASFIDRERIIATLQYDPANEAARIHLKDATVGGWETSIDYPVTEPGMDETTMNKVYFLGVINAFNQQRQNCFEIGDQIHEVNFKPWVLSTEELTVQHAALEARWH